MSFFQNYSNNRNVCLKGLLGVLSGEKAPVGAGTFPPATPQVVYSAYISALIGVLEKA